MEEKFTEKMRKKSVRNMKIETLLLNRLSLISRHPYNKSIRRLVKSNNSCKLKVIGTQVTLLVA